MPSIFRHDGFRFFIYSNEGDPREPIHIHFMGANGEAKFWIASNANLPESAGLDARTLRCLTGVIEARRMEIERAWHDHFPQTGQFR